MRRDAILGDTGELACLYLLSRTRNQRHGWVEIVSFQREDEDGFWLSSLRLSRSDTSFPFDDGFEDLIG